MADCNDTLRALQTFLDGELSPEAQHGIDDHLGSCLDCLQAYDFHAELRQVIATKCRNDEMPPELLHRIELCLGEDIDGDGRVGPSSTT